MREWKYASVDLSTDITTITHVPCLVKGWHCTVATSGHVCNINDSSNTVFAIPANVSEGDYFDGDQVRFETNLIVDPNNSATGTVSIFYRVLGNE